MASLFTKIINGEIPCYEVAQNGDYIAFLDINPMKIGHTLIVPKKEVDYIFDLDDETLSGLILFAKVVAKKLQQEIACNRVATVVMGLEVPHAHIHLIPIDSEDDVDFNRPKLSLTSEEFVELQKRLYFEM